MPAFPLLADDGYQPNTFNYAQKDFPELPTYEDWIGVFRKSIPEFQQRAAADPAVEEATRKDKAGQFATRYLSILDTLESDPHASIEGFGSNVLNCISLCRMRDECLRQAGFQDPFATVKLGENVKALSLLPDVLKELDVIEDQQERMASALKGVFAGNIFDLGSAASSKLFADGGDAGKMFMEAKANLVSRPWAVDKFDEVLARFEGPAHVKAMLFLDNAGSDAVLGMLPFARELLKRGTEVILAANDVPSINDITVIELQHVLLEAGKVDVVLQQYITSGAVAVIGSGNDLPVIDLSNVGSDVVREATGVDLVVLEGMGRGIETNLYARLQCERLNLGMIKHPEVAALLNGRLYDVVCEYQQPP